MQIQTFTFRNDAIRTLLLDGEPWFVATDVAGILELGNPRSSLALLDDDERDVHIVDTPSGPQSMTIISESGLYSLILRSCKPEARPFKRSGTEHHNLPYQQQLERDYFKVITRPRPNSTTGRVTQTTRITAKGLTWLQKGIAGLPNPTPSLGASA